MASFFQCWYRNLSLQVSSLFLLAKMAVAKVVSVEEMKDLALARGLSYSDISNILVQKNPKVRGISERSVRRYCTLNGIRKKTNMSKEDLKKIVVLEASKVGDRYGRKLMTGHLRSKGLQAGERQVGSILREVDIKGNKERKVNAGRCLNPNVYSAEYFGHKIHYDQNEKLVMYGVVHVCARDGYSGLIVGFSTMPIKNNVTIYDEVYRPASETYGIWDQVRVDGGTEFALISHMQSFYRDYRNNKARDPVKSTKSVHNNIIERIWVEVNNRVNYPIKAVLNDLVARDVIDMANVVTKFCISWVTCRVAYFGLSQFVASWNHHTIPGKGIPIQLAQKNQKTGKVPMPLMTSAFASNHYYETTGNHLTQPHSYGTDPLDGNIDLQRSREERFYAIFKSEKEIFESLMSGDKRKFERALCYFQNLTIILCQ